MSKKMFKNITLKQKICMYFEEKGFKQSESRTSKYSVYFGNGKFYFIGKNGAVRVNSKNSVTNSLSITSQFKPILVKWSESKNSKEFHQIN